MSEIGNVSNPNFGMGDTSRINEGSLPVAAKAKAPNPIAAEKHNDAEASVQDPTHSQDVERPKEQGFEMTIFPLFQDLLETTSKIRKEIIQVNTLAKEITSDNDTSKNNELRKTEESEEPLLKVQANIEPERVLKLMEDEA